MLGWNLEFGILVGIWIWVKSMSYKNIHRKSLEFGFGIGIPYAVVYY